MRKLPLVSFSSFRSVLSTARDRSDRSVWAALAMGLMSFVWAQSLAGQTAAVVLPNTPSTSQPGTAAFLGNFTTVKDPAQAMMLVRGADCTLARVSGSYTVGTRLAYTPAGVEGSYDRILHNEAGLTTTPGVFASGCGAPGTGFESAFMANVGTTTSGINVIAISAYSPITAANAIYVVSGQDVSTYTLATNSFASAGALNTADLDKDGNGDLIVLNSTSTTAASVSILLGNPDGTFKTAVKYPTAGTGAQAATIDDFNGDGKLDIAVISAHDFTNLTAPQQVSILLGNGDGSFQAAQSFTLPAISGYSAGQSIANYIISASLRGNGKKDLILSNGLVCLGKGDGTFAATATPPLPFFSDSYAAGPHLASGDLNNDGKVDVVLNDGSSVNVFLGNGDGTFKTGNRYDSLSGLYSAGYISVSDLDGDGNPDIWVGVANGGLYFGDSFGPNLAYALMGNGDGTLQGAPQAVNGAAYVGGNLGDVNGDGQPDLIADIVDATHSATSTFTVQLGTPSGFFNPVSTIAPPSTFSLGGIAFTGAGTPSAYAVADVDGDGKADLVFVDTGLTALNPGNHNAPYTYSSPVLFVAISNGDGTFKTPVAYAFPQLAPAGDYDNTLVVSNMRIADFDKDGHNDLILTYNDLQSPGFGGPPINDFNEGFVVLLGNGDGTFKPTPSLTSTYSSNTANSTSALPFVAATGDLNGDGTRDLLVLHPYFTLTNGVGVNTTQVVTYLGNGDGTFKAPVTFPTANKNFSPVLLDFNLDGKLDLAFIEAPDQVSPGQLLVALGNGDGTFKPATTDFNISSAFSLAAADFNGDGKPDIALLGQVSGIFYGNGDGTFTSISASGNNGPTDLIGIATDSPSIAIDLNKDGKPDILTGGIGLLNLYSAPPPTINLGALSASTIKVAESATTIPAGTGVTFTGTITPATGATATPSGHVTFLNGDAILGTGTVAANKATFTTATLAPGTYNVLAVYEGDTNFDGNFSPPVTLIVTGSAAVATTTTLTALPTNAVSGTSIAFTATVAPASGTVAPTGAVTFLDGATAIGTGNLTAGVATFSTAALAVGPHSVTASYAGVAGTFAASTSTPAVAVTITAPSAVATTTTLTALPTNAVSGTSIAFTATVAPASGTVAPTGAVTFLDGATAIGTGNLTAGVATFSTAALAVGPHSITASYAGVAGTFAASTSSPAVVVTITAPVTPGFSISLSSTANSVAPGNSVSTTLTVTPIAGFSQATALTCAGAVTYTTCTIAPNSVTPSGTAAATAVVTLATTAQARIEPQEGWPFRSNRDDRLLSLAALPAGILFSALLFARRSKRRRLPVHLLAFGIVALLLAATGCGSKSLSSTGNGPPAQTVTLTVTATSGAISQNTTWTVSILP